MTPIYPSAHAAAVAHFGNGEPEEGWLTYADALLAKKVIVPVPHPRGWAPREWQLTESGAAKERKGGWYVLQVRHGIVAGPLRTRKLAVSAAGHRAGKDFNRRQAIKGGVALFVEGVERFRVLRGTHISSPNGQEEAMADIATQLKTNGKSITPAPKPTKKAKSKAKKAPAKKTNGNGKAKAKPKAKVTRKAKAAAKVSPKANKKPKADLDHTAIAKLLTKHNGNLTAVANELGVKAGTLFQRLKRAGFDLDRKKYQKA